MDGLDDVVDDLQGRAVLVVGDAMLDEYVLGSAVRICREGPAPVVHVNRRRREPGGAGNVAANAAALGARVAFLSVVGDDRDGHLLREALVARGVPDGDVLTEPGRTTLAKRRVVADGQLLLRVDDGDPVDLSGQAEDELLRRLDAAYPTADAVVVSDYGYRAVSDRIVERLAVLQRRHSAVLVVDAHDLARYREVGATAVKPNYGEALPLMSGQPAQGGERAAGVAAEARHILEATGSRIAAVTLDADGAVVCERGRAPYRTWARPGATTGACGAGDSYTATLALALASGLGTTRAAALAQAAAEVVTGREGTSTCSADDLRQQVGGGTEAVRVPEELAA
ncbi:MAG: bifunctional heptose 7-phosphate kinase/heptose 1-phosphate adenyltransferase, partial [Actinomycetes bacterium]